MSEESRISFRKRAVLLLIYRITHKYLPIHVCLLNFLIEITLWSNLANCCAILQKYCRDDGTAKSEQGSITFATLQSFKEIFHQFFYALWIFFSKL